MLSEQSENARANGEPSSPRKRLRRQPLRSLQGVIAEMTRQYQRMKKGKVDHETGRSLIWSLDKLRSAIEAQELERMTTRLEELQQLADRRHGSNGHREPQRLLEAETLPN